MYKPLPQEQSATNQPPVAPSQKITHPEGSIRVLAPEGHFPVWLIDELKSITSIEVTTYQTTLQGKEKLLSQSFDLYLISDRSVIEAISHQKLHPLPSVLIDPKNGPIAAYLNHPFDPRNQKSLPYGCTYYGFAFHKDAFAKGIKKWKDLFHSDDFAQADFPQDPELFYLLTVIADEQVGKPDKKLDFKTPSNSQAEELPIRVRTLSELYPLADQNPHWQVVLPEDGSAIELYHLALGSESSAAIEVAKKFLNPLVAARISEENQFSSTLKSVQTLLSPIVRKKLNPDSKWTDKSLFIRPPKAAKVHSTP